MPSRFSPVVPAVSVIALVLMAQTVGSGQRFGGIGDGQSNGRGAVQTAPPAKPPASQTPPSSQPRTAQGQQRTPEQFLMMGWDWWKDEAVKKELKLTDRQVQRINGIIDSRVRRVTPTYEAYRKEVDELNRMIKERTADIATFEVQAGRAEFLRSKLQETRYVMLYAIYRELDPLQYQKLQELLDRRGRGRGGSPQPRTW